ncbi:Asp-tRNA(Asn)/Glu-tRNA(Gln) amidotransferase subunit GatC [Candidatus Dependentiae bacterium]|nr:Asp-tRNA(Asn)/Glu-tRNA(Gln) amidotransferase subunit GatC [Candidatus Dependentiae bacterium]
MVKFDKEELLKLADLSALKLYDDEIDNLVDQIKKLLDYTEELSQVKLSKEVAPIKNVNTFREDEIIKFDSKPLLDQAPEKKDNFFVVPKILKQ